jgi:hypothetical protein
MARWEVVVLRVQNASLLNWLQETEIVTSTFRDFEVEHNLSSMLMGGHEAFPHSHD